METIISLLIVGGIVYILYTIFKKWIAELLKPKADKDREAQQICTNCHYVGRGATSGSFLIEIILWLFMIVPGLIYTIWRVGKKGKQCPECKTPNMISTLTPRGQKLLKEVEGVEA